LKQVSWHQELIVIVTELCKIARLHIQGATKMLGQISGVSSHTKTRKKHTVFEVHPNNAFTHWNYKVRTANLALANVSSYGAL
jgi:hypothetical protein